MQRYLQKFAVKNFLEVRLGPFSTTVKRHNLLQANHHIAQGVLEPKVPAHVSTQFGTANWTPYSEIKTVCKTPMPIKLCVGPSETSGVVMIV